MLFRVEEHLEKDLTPKLSKWCHWHQESMYLEADCQDVSTNLHSPSRSAWCLASLNRPGIRSPIHSCTTTNGTSFASEDIICISIGQYSQFPEESKEFLSIQLPMWIRIEETHRLNQNNRSVIHRQSIYPSGFVSDETSESSNPCASTTIQNICSPYKYWTDRTNTTSLSELTRVNSFYWFVMWRSR